MSDTKSTSGPWTTENATGRLPLDIICDYQIPGAGFPVVIATVFSDEEEDADFQTIAGSIGNRQAMANARLVAARTEFEINAVKSEYDFLASLNNGRAS